jgi:type I restriction enzyme, S subunit
MTKWETRCLGDVADLSLGKMLDQRKNRGEPLPYLANINVRWGEFDLDNLREMRFEEKEKERFGLKFGDIVMCEGGEPGRCAIWKEPILGMMFQKALHRIRPHECLDSRFLFYAFLYKGRMNGFAGLFTGSTIKHLPAEKLAKLEIEFPELVQQRRIADVLSAYDELIENNRRRMGLLEQTARLLYREWFVRLRFPGHEHTCFVDGLPQGWERVPLGERVTLNYGKSLREDERIKGPVPVYGSSGIVGSHEQALTKGPGIIIGRKGNVGSVYWSSTDFWPIDTVYFVKAETSNLYLFYALKEMHFISTDVAVPGLNRDFAYSRPLVLPATNVLREFLEIVSPMHEQIDKLDEQNQRLRAARDLLLPRLMSGEVAV